MNLTYITLVDDQVLHPLSIYTPFIRRAGFLPLARLTISGVLIMDSVALMTLVDRWRPEIHTFHLPCSETTVMAPRFVGRCLQLG
jgi:hypothetical protein